MTLIKGAFAQYSFKSARPNTGEDPDPHTWCEFESQGETITLLFPNAVAAQFSKGDLIFIEVK